LNPLNQTARISRDVPQSHRCIVRTR
jgi:hypothetical protein